MKNGSPKICERACTCGAEHKPKFVVLTGGPGAGKSAVLEMAQKLFCQHIAILPEAASIVFGGGFWRLSSAPARESAQRAIYHVQREMENLVIGEKKWALGLCDRGALDGLAYWPGDPQSFWDKCKSTPEEELSRYMAVIHLRAPSRQQGYNYQNPLRIETPEEAKLIDERIAQIWSQHPFYIVIESHKDFLVKAGQAIEIISRFIPDCCK